jgi:predicted PurR-regulated permease PerM
VRAEIFRWFARGSALAFGAALSVAVIYVLLAASGVVVLVFIALLLASGVEPLVDRVRTRTPLARGATLLFVYAGIFVIIATLVLLIVPSAINQFNDLGTRIQPLLADARAWAATLEPRAVSQGLLALLDTLEQAIAPSESEAPDPDHLIHLGLTFAEAVISVLAVLTMVYFWLTERARLQRFVLALLPAERRAGTRDAWNQMEGRLGSWVRGQLIIMGSVGIATTVAYFLIGLEGALLLGLLAALFELIPLVGPALGAIPALAVAALTGSIETVLLVAVVYFIIQVVEGNVLIPLVMHNTIGVPPFLVIVSILVGAAVAGIPGALLSVPIVAVMLVVLERLQARDSPVPISPEKQPPEELEDLVEDEPAPARP